jgi:hypothetical protein
LTVLPFIVLIGLSVFLVFRSVRTPGIALVGLFSMFAIEQWAQSQSSFFVERNVLINVLFAMITGFALYLRVVRGELRSEPYPLGAKLVILLYLYALLSTYWTDEAIDVQSIWTAHVPYIIVQVFVAPLLLADPRELTKIFAYQIFIGGLFAALIIFGSEVTGRRITLGDDGSITGSPLSVAEAGGITVICAVLMTRLFKGDVIIKVIISAICIFAIVRSGSRGQLIALAFALIAAFPMTYSIKNPKLVVGSVLVVLILGYVTYVGLELFWQDSGRFSSEGMSDDYALRIGKVTRLMSAWLANPAAIIFGLGNSASFSLSINGSYPHFIPIEILCEEGVIGFLIYAWVLAIVAREALYVGIYRSGTRQETSGLAILFGIIVYLFFISLKQGSFLSSTPFFMSTILFIRTVAYIRQTDKQERRETAAAEVASGAARFGALPVGLRPKSQ